MGLLEELRRQKGLIATCSHCDSDFPLSQANLFDATRRLPPHALAYLEERQAELVDQKAELSRRRAAAKTRPAVAARASGIGKVVEKIALSLPGFPHGGPECRALFEPIDYVVFKGLANSGRVSSVIFADVKSGNARLSRGERSIRDLVTSGQVRLLIADHRRAP